MLSVSLLTPTDLIHSEASCANVLNLVFSTFARLRDDRRASKLAAPMADTHLRCGYRGTHAFRSAALSGRLDRSREDHLRDALLRARRRVAVLHRRMDVGAV